MKITQAHYDKIGFPYSYYAQDWQAKDNKLLSDSEADF